MKDRGALLAFVLLTALPFLGKAWHIDEPFFLHIAEQIRRDPFRPVDFEIFWSGRYIPMAELNNNPLLLPYLLAGALRLTGADEWAMRLLFLPFSALAALALHGIAARFLKRPLLPTLIALAAPAYFLNQQHLMTERLTATFGFSALYALLRGLDGSRRWFWASAGLLAAATLSKYNAVCFLLPAFGLLVHHRTAPRLLAGYAAAAAGPLALYLGWGFVFDPGRLTSAWDVVSQGAAGSAAEWAHRLRSLAAFIGGGAAAAALWPWTSFSGAGRRSRLAAAGGAALALPLFLPALDAWPVTPADRVLGLAFAGSGLAALGALLFGERRGRGWELWAPWTLGFGLMQAFVYWSVVSRLVMFLVVPLVLGLAAELEARRPAEAWTRLHAVGLAATLGLSLALGWVDRRHADAQRDLAALVAERYPGRRLWFTGHWGLQHYLEKLGGTGLDPFRGGWSAVRPGDVVVVPRTNSNLSRPATPLRARLHATEVRHPLPLRLTTPGAEGQAGFYSNVFGFLPYGAYGGPVEAFEILEPL